MVWPGFGEVADQRVRMIEHTDLAHAGNPIVGLDLHEGQVAPGGSQHHRRDLRNFHGLAHFNWDGLDALREIDSCLPLLLTAARARLFGTVKWGMQRNA